MSKLSVIVLFSMLLCCDSSGSTLRSEDSFGWRSDAVVDFCIASVTEKRALFMYAISQQCKKPEFKCMDIDLEKFFNDMQDEIQECIEKMLEV